MAAIARSAKRTPADKPVRWLRRSENRVSANDMPANQRSASLLARRGFQIEGRARRLVAIDGVWQDHVLTARLNPRRLP